MAKIQPKKVSIVIPVKNEGGNLKRTIDSILHSKVNLPFEIIVVNDGSSDDGCDFLKKQREVMLINTSGVGSAMARNIGAQKANGEFLLFCDAHIFIEDFLIDSLIETLALGKADAINPGIADSNDLSRKGYGYTWNSELEPKWNTDIDSHTFSPLLAGGCLAITKSAFIDVGGFEKGFKIWGREDEEISLKLWLFGYKCLIEPHKTAIHVFRSYPPYELDWDDLYYNLMRMAYSHFSNERIEKCKRLIQYSDPDFIVSQVLQSDVLIQRKIYFKRRMYDDDWYMKQFGINF